jgi:hypothetical protein
MRSFSLAVLLWLGFLGAAGEQQQEKTLSAEEVKILFREESNVDSSALSYDQIREEILSAKAPARLLSELYAGDADKQSNLDSRLLQLVSRSQLTQEQKNELFALFLVLKMRFVEPRYLRNRFKESFLSAHIAQQSLFEKKSSIAGGRMLSPHTISLWQEEQVKDKQKEGFLAYFFSKPGFITLFLGLLTLLNHYDVRLKEALSKSLFIAVVFNYSHVIKVIERLLTFTGAFEYQPSYNLLMIQVLESAEAQLQGVYDQHEIYLPAYLAGGLKELLEELSGLDYMRLGWWENSILDQFCEKLVMFENQMAEIAHFTQPEN